MEELNISNIIFAFIISMSIPSAVTAFCFWMIQRKITKRDNKRDEIDKARKKNEFLLIRGIGAAIALGEASAIAIRDKKCNGEMSVALEYAQKVKREQKDFLTEQGVENLY